VAWYSVGCFGGNTLAPHGARQVKSLAHRTLHSIKLGRVWWLSLFFAVIAAAPAAQAAPNLTSGIQGEHQSAVESLSIHHGNSDGFVFPRDGVAPLPAIATRKKPLKQPIDIVGGKAALSIAPKPEAQAQIFYTIAGHAHSSHVPTTHPWQSRAPPSVS
jgi:hypothetical protein